MYDDPTNKTTDATGPRPYVTDEAESSSSTTDSAISENTPLLSHYDTRRYYNSNQTNIDPLFRADAPPLGESAHEPNNPVAGEDIDPGAPPWAFKRRCKTELL